MLKCLAQLNCLKWRCSTYVWKQSCTHSSCSSTLELFLISLFFLLVLICFLVFYPQRLNKKLCPFLLYCLLFLYFLPFFSFPPSCLPTSYPTSWLLAGFRAKGGSTGIKDVRTWQIFSMPQYTEDTVGPCQNQSDFHSSPNPVSKGLWRCNACLSCLF